MTDRIDDPQKQTKVKKPVFNKDDYIRMYELYRKYCNHEDNLVDQRNSWFIGLNSFLFTSIALSFFVFGEDYYSKASVLVFLFAGLISTVGVVSGIATLRSVHSAFKAIYSLDRQWLENYEGPFQDEARSAHILLPSMMGGKPPYKSSGNKNARHGLWVSYGLTSTIGVCWLIVGSFSASGYVDQCITQLQNPKKASAVASICWPFGTSNNANGQTETEEQLSALDIRRMST